MFDNDCLPPPSDSGRPRQAGSRRTDASRKIRLQAQEIIEETLQRPVGAGFDARERLLRRLQQAQYPERAEEVLLAHLQEMVSLNNPGGGKYQPQTGA